MKWEASGALLREACGCLGADAVTLAVRGRGSERVVVCTADGTVVEATGSLSLGLVAPGPSRLAGGIGILQAAEGSTLFGFNPSGYLGAPFGRRRPALAGGVAAWSREGRRWRAAEGARLRELAVLCATVLSS